MTDYTALREAAEKATPGEWRQHLVDDTCVLAKDGDEICTTWTDGGNAASPDHNTPIEQHEADARYIALANPTTILSLLDALATARIDALEEVRRATEDNADDEAEQNAFEAWGAAEKYNMTKHPMHWLFLDNQTYNARKGWRGALAHVDAVIRALKVKS